MKIIVIDCPTSRTTDKAFGDRKLNELLKYGFIKPQHNQLDAISITLHSGQLQCFVCVWSRNSIIS